MEIFCGEMSTERKNVARFSEEEGIESESFGLKAGGTLSPHRKRENERERERERERTNGSNDEARVRERNGG